MFHVIAYIASMGEYHPYRREIVINFPKLNIKIIINLADDEEGQCTLMTINGYEVNPRFLYECLHQLHYLENNLPNNPITD